MWRLRGGLVFNSGVQGEKGEAAGLPFPVFGGEIGVEGKEQQVPPLRYAPVGMTPHLGNYLAFPNEIVIPTRA
jgi:hypothetical protein